MKNKTFLPVLLAALLMFACSEDAPIADPSIGDINPEVYVAIGNSLTAGYQSGALFASAQQYSYPNLLAKALGTPTFIQPQFDDPGVGALMVLRQILPSPIITSNDSTFAPPSNFMQLAPYHNLGIPGAIMYDAIDKSSVQQRYEQRGNPFYYLIMRDQENLGESLLEQAFKLNPTVLTFWLGSNDVLGYAASGGTRGSNPTGTGPTDVTAFQTIVRSAFALIKNNLPDTKVLIGNVPDPTVAPFFTTVPRALPNPTDPENPISLWYRTADNTVKTVGEGDYVLLTAQAMIAQGYGPNPQQPLPSMFVLDAAELKTAQDAVQAFNDILEAEAAASGFTLVDLHQLLNDLRDNGYNVAGESYGTSYISGGLFSLDGLHLMPRGNAIVANEFIKAMNRDFGANIRYIPLYDLPGFPAPTGLHPKAASDWSPEMRYEQPDMPWLFGSR
ncbi:hypothetical protein KQI65_05830 [bacterium]|nr:hypothetical protein [bacterium]